jgi:O-antigen/teichoic acid export membrane protein
MSGTVETTHLRRLINLGLRGMTLVCRFLLIFFLAGFLEPKELGLYGLLSATISYSLYLLGFDFYTYTTRELVKHERHEWGALLKDQGALHLILYALVMPLLLVVFGMGLLPWNLAGWFFVLLVLEHLNQELIRLLVAISQQLTASWMLFLRSGIWALVISVWMYFDSSMRTLESVLAAWALGGALALFLAMYRLKKLNLSGWSTHINWQWLLKGLKIAVPFLVATLSIRAVFTIDRYWLEALQGLEVLGAYVLFMGIANALMSFLDAGVFSFSYPDLIAAHHRRDAVNYRSALFRLLWQTLLLTAVFAFATWLVMKPLLIVIDKPFYLTQIPIFPWVMGAVAFYAAGMVPHYALYAQGLDRPIIFSHLGAIVVFISVTALLSVTNPDKAVPAGLVATFIVLFLWKTWAFYRLTPRHYRSFVVPKLS